MTPHEVVEWLDLLNRYPVMLVVLLWLSVELRRFFGKLLEHMTREEEMLTELRRLIEAAIRE